VRADAYAAFNLESREWELAGDVFEKGSVCESCGQECSLESFQFDTSEWAVYALVGASQGVDMTCVAIDGQVGVFASDRALSELAEAAGEAFEQDLKWRLQQVNGPSDVVEIAQMSGLDGISVEDAATLMSREVVGAQIHGGISA